MVIDTKHSFISRADCHHVERISCKTTETWKLRSVVSDYKYHTAVAIAFGIQMLSVA